MANINEWEEICQAWNLTGNKYLDGDTNESNNNEQNFRKALLNATAKGTKEYSYLDPIPFINRIKQCYTNLTKNIGNIESARTDSIKMNRDNMDYTNDSDPQVGLNLLMPQYHRRVEVEDLDENFWVIGNVLDAVVSSLWRTNGIVDMIGELVERVIMISDYLGLSNISDVDVLHGDTDDLTFNMFTRFTLNSLKIRLHSNTGERIIGDFIRQYNKESLPAKDYYGGDGILSQTYESLDEYYLAFNKQINYGTGENGKGRREGVRDAEIIFAKDEDGKYSPLFWAIDRINDKTYSPVNISTDYNKYFDIDGSGTIDNNDPQRLAEDLAWINSRISEGSIAYTEFTSGENNKADLRERLLNGFYSELYDIREEPEASYLNNTKLWKTFEISGTEDDTSTSTLVHIPNVSYAALIAGILSGNRANPFDPDSVIDINNIEEPDASHEYRTQGQLLIFLYNKNFYNLECNESEYVLIFKKNPDSTERKYTFQNDPEKSSLNFLFIPRSDLIEGEILQFSIREEGITPYTCKFPAGGGNVEYTDPEINLENFPFLSLHNVFARIPQQYNYRTALMFKNTSPEFSLSAEKPLEKLKDSNNHFDFDKIFQNGVYIQYHNAENASGKSVSLPFVIRFKANMIAQNKVVTPSSCFVQGVVMPSTTDVLKFKEISIVSKEYYTAGSINNLMFYGTGSHMENNIPVHTNLNLIHSEDIKGYDETIQGGPSTTYGKKGELADIFKNITEESTIDNLLKQFSFNSLEGKPSHFEICFHRRYVDNYVKRKKLKYIVIKKEKGEGWHESYGINQIGISAFLFKNATNDTQTIVSTTELTSEQTSAYFRWVTEGGKDVYGVLDFESLLKNFNLSSYLTQLSVDGYIIRFYHCEKPDNTDETLFKRPRANMIYFLGEDASGDSTVIRSYFDNATGGGE